MMWSTSALLGLSPYSKSIGTPQIEQRVRPESMAAFSACVRTRFHVAVPVREVAIATITPVNPSWPARMIPP